MPNAQRMFADAKDGERFTIAYFEARPRRPLESMPDPMPNGPPNSDPEYFVRAKQIARAFEHRLPAPQRCRHGGVRCIHETRNGSIGLCLPES